MRKFKGDEGEWRCVFAANNTKRAVRNDGHLICTMTKPSHFSGQDERYEKELDEMRCSQKLISAAPLLIEAIQELKQHAILNGSEWDLKEPQSLFDKVDIAINKALGDEEV